jgi:hypothetical protein
MFRGLIVAFLVDDTVGDIEENFFIHPHWFTTYRAAQPSNNFEHGLTSLILFIHLKNKNSFKKGKILRCRICRLPPKDSKKLGIPTI